MGLKPDHWIRKMALEQKMIEPFVDKQVRLMHDRDIWARPDNGTGE